MVRVMLDLETLDARLRAIKLIALDADGVLTDGGLFIGVGGELKRYDITDGLAIVLARKCGLRVIVISGRASESTAKRATELKIDECHQDVRDKTAVLRDAALRAEAGPQETLYMGDDIVDLGAMAWAGVAVAPASARAEAKAQADWVTEARGGHGAVREAIERVLRAQERWDAIVESYRKS